MRKFESTMNKFKLLLAVGCLLPTWIPLHAQDASEQLPADHADCAFFGPQRDKYLDNSKRRISLSELTERVTNQMQSRAGNRMMVASVQPTTLARNAADLSTLGTIDRNIFGVLQDKGVAPARKTTDWEFVRRVTIDLTGRIPTPDRVLAFVNDNAPDKRAKLIDELLNTSQWVDKWTMFFSDKYMVAERDLANGTLLYQNGRQAFHDFIYNSLASNKPYNKMASEIIAAEGTNGWEQGELNWTVRGRISNGPAQDTWDQLAVNVADTFLGISFMNCIECHNGRGHTDSMSLWATSARRSQAWQLSAFFAKTTTRLIRPNPAVNNSPYYWQVNNDYRATVSDYTLNTTTGNRPARQPMGTQRTVAPVYPFSGRGPMPGDDYRQFLAKEVTSDFQFSRAAVNYIWKEFFSKGMVEPVDQFDLLRLDPDNPPPEPWGLQPTNALLLKQLAQDFIDGGFDLKALMRQIVNSEAYQMSSTYDGNWDPAYEALNARKLVRRLWAEEIHDSLTVASNVVPTYNILVDANRVAPPITINWAMQIPSPASGEPTAAANFLDSFYRGNRQDEDRKPDGSDLQTLFMMNDNFVISRTRVSGSGSTTSLLGKSLTIADDSKFVDNLYLTVLSRYPTDAERVIALKAMKATSSRLVNGQNLLWSLYNKVDFFFNY